MRVTLRSTKGPATLTRPRYCAVGRGRVKELYFSDFWGQIKSLGAWGGDLVLVTSNRGLEETAEYFKSKGFNSLLSYGDLILNTQQASLFEGDPAANVHEFNL